MTPTDQTPDAVRAAIASNGEQVQLDPIVAEIAALMPIERRRWSRDDYADETQDVWVARAIYDRLAQIGALRPVGETIHRVPLRRYRVIVEGDARETEGANSWAALGFALESIGIARGFDKDHERVIRPDRDDVLRGQVRWPDGKITDYELVPIDAAARAGDGAT